jgi:hypothetical protein
MTAWFLLGTVLGLAPPTPAPQASDELAAPVKVLAAGKPINVDIGHAAPFFADIEGRGVKDLLVGQFGDGKLRIYRNVGSDREPKFETFSWFLDGKPQGTVPSG